MEACALALQSEDLSKKERRRRRSDLNDTNIAWPARARGGRKKVAAYFFFTTLGFPAGVFPDVLRVGFF